MSDSFIPDDTPSQTPQDSFVPDNAGLSGAMPQQNILDSIRNMIKQNPGAAWQVAGNVAQNLPQTPWNYVKNIPPRIAGWEAEKLGGMGVNPYIAAGLTAPQALGPDLLALGSGVAEAQNIATGPQQVGEAIKDIPGARRLAEVVPNSIKTINKYINAVNDSLDANEINTAQTALQKYKEIDSIFDTPAIQGIIRKGQSSPTLAGLTDLRQQITQILNTQVPARAAAAKTASEYYNITNALKTLGATAAYPVTHPLKTWALTTLYNAVKGH